MKNVKRQKKLLNIIQRCLKIKGEKQNANLLSVMYLTTGKNGLKVTINEWEKQIYSIQHYVN